MASDPSAADLAATVRSALEVPLPGVDPEPSWVYDALHALDALLARHEIVRHNAETTEQELGELRVSYTECGTALNATRSDLTATEDALAAAEAEVARLTAALRAANARPGQTPFQVEQMLHRIAADTLAASGRSEEARRRAEEENARYLERLP